MKNVQISLSDNLNLITIKNLCESPNSIVSFLEENGMNLVTCNIRPSGLIDIIFIAEDTQILKISSHFTSFSPVHNTVTIRSGVSCVLISFQEVETYHCEPVTSFFEQENVCIERIIVSKNRVEVFFPASEVCGSVRNFVEKLEEHLNRQ